MADDLIPKRVREFIAENIDSVAELEALMLMYRHPESSWSADSLAQRLYTSLEQTEEVFGKLCALGLADTDAGKPATCSYRPSSPGLDDTVRAVADIYAKYLVPVTNLIHSKPQTKVQQFADAFKLKKRRDK